MRVIPGWRGLVLFTAVFSASSTLAADYGTESFKKLYFGVGALGYNMGRFGQDASGGTKITGTVYPDIAVGLRLNIGAIAFAPTWAYTLLGRKGKDQYTSRVMVLTAPVSYPIGDFDLKGGPGLLWYQVSGNGGKRNLPNGNDFDEFYIPSGSSSTRLYMLTAGVGFRISDVRLDLDTYVTDTFSGARRAVSTAFHVTYGLFN